MEFMEGIVVYPAGSIKFFGYMKILVHHPSDYISNGIEWWFYGENRRDTPFYYSFIAMVDGGVVRK